MPHDILYTEGSLWKTSLADGWWRVGGSSGTTKREQLAISNCMYVINSAPPCGRPPTPRLYTAGSPLLLIILRRLKSGMAKTVPAVPAALALEVICSHLLAGYNLYHMNSVHYWYHTISWSQFTTDIIQLAVLHQFTTDIIQSTELTVSWVQFTTDIQSAELSLQLVT